MKDNESKPKTGSTDGRYVGQFDWGETSPNTAIVAAVATAANRDESDLDVLYDYVDPDAIEALFRDGTGDVELTFTFDGHRVTVRGDGTVFVEPEG